MTLRQLGLHYVALMLICPFCAYLWHTQLQLSQASQQMSTLALQATSYLPRQHLIHQLQAERGMTLGFYSGKLSPPPNLALQQWLVDAALRDLQTHIFEQFDAETAAQHIGITHPSVQTLLPRPSSMTPQFNSPRAASDPRPQQQPKAYLSLTQLALRLKKLRHSAQQQSLTTLFSQYSDLIHELSWSQRLWLSPLQPSTFLPSIQQVDPPSMHLFFSIKQAFTSVTSHNSPEQMALSSTNSITEQLRQLHLLAELKEKTGQERALVQLTLASKQLTESRLQSIVVLQDAQHQLLTTYQSAASPFMQAHLLRILQLPLRQRIEDLRQQVRQNQLVADANLWFSLLSQWMDDLLWLEKKQFHQLQQVITEQQAQQRQLEHILTPLIWGLLCMILLILSRIAWWQSSRLRRLSSALFRFARRPHPAAI